MVWGFLLLCYILLGNLGKVKVQMTQDIEIVLLALLVKILLKGKHLSNTLMIDNPISKLTTKTHVNVIIIQ